MKAIAVAALAGLLTAGCASTGQKLAYDQEGCVLNHVMPSTGGVPWSNDRIRSGDPGHRTKANCTSNRALEQMASTRQDQHRNTATSFPSETPAP